MVYISSVDARPDVTMTNLEVYVMGDVNEWLNLPEDEEYSTEVTGTFKVNYYANGVPSKDISSTKDTATKDTVTKSATGGNGSFQGIVAGLYQTFGGEELYRSTQEKAANLLYQVVKDHPFSDGNKRCAAALFVYFLNGHSILGDDDAPACGG